MSKREWLLYWYAIGRWMSVIVNHAAERGRGWYHFANGESFCASEVEL